ncbi:MAG: sulfite exporter TauE/SafE family protein [Synechococcaceae cyanobacterium]|nr:sulfite exporter TauE/SafE family protein [Synechococcaceae cyanobacterium]
MSPPDLLLQLALFGAALLANLLSALAGGGAGLVQLPVLILLGLSFPLALATHKLASVALGVGASLRHWRERSLNPRLAAFVLATGLPGVVLGARVVLALPPRLCTGVLGLLTIGLGLYSLSRPSLGVESRPRPLTTPRLVGGGVGLFAIGFLNGSLTSGTGLFVTLWLVRWFGLDYGRAVAYTLVLVGLFWNGAGALTLGHQGQIAWSWVPMLLAGSIAGGYLGAHLAIVRGSQVVKRAFEVLALLMGSSLLWKSL